MMDRPESKLRTWRIGAGLSVVEAAARVKVSRQTWHGWERGATIPPVSLMQRIFDLTGGAVTANDFYDLPSPSETSEAA